MPHGSVRPVVAGSGKTTLLDVVAGRTVTDFHGTVTYAGQNMTSQRFRKYAGYVIQADRYFFKMWVAYRTA